jgi:hypothetical protein
MIRMCYVSAYCLVTIPLAGWAQSSRQIPLESAKQIFTEAQTLCQADDGRLWGVSLCAPIMLVDRDSRSIVANQADANGTLQSEGGVFVGTMPKDQNIANTAVESSGVQPATSDRAPGGPLRRHGAAGGGDLEGAARQQLVVHNKAKFIDGAVLTVQFRHMQIQFDPRNLQPLGSAGTVYPTMRVADDWGVLDVSDGALLKSDWSCVTVSAPAAIAGSRIKGGGWSLELKPGWKLVSGTRTGDYLLEPVA